jgi:hypothetical protein
MGSEPCGISAETAKKAVRDCTKRGCKRYWESLIGKAVSFSTVLEGSKNHNHTENW